MITEAEYNTWLRDDTNHRVILCELEYYDSGYKKLYLGTSPYITEPTDTPANTTYKGVIKKVDPLESSIKDPVDFSSIEIVNYVLDGDIEGVGEFDWLLDYPFEGQDIQMYLGDKSWSKTDFKQIFCGRIENIEMLDKETIVFNIRNHSEDLNIDLQLDSSDFYDGTEEVDGLEGIPKPICIGWVKNITPVLISYITEETYQVHNGRIFGITEVRENGRPLSYPEEYTIDWENGTFTLVNRSTGLITVDVQGGYHQSTYFGNPMDIVIWLSRKVGFDNINTSPGDINSLLYYNDNKCDYECGVYITDKITAQAAIEDFLEGLASYITFTGLGVMEINRLDLPDPNNRLGEVIQDDILLGEFNLVETIPPTKATKVTYEPNYSIQEPDTLAADILDRSSFNKEYKLVTINTTDPNLNLKYPLVKESDTIITYIYLREDAQTEAVRRQLLNNSKRFIYTLNVYNPKFSTELGGTIRIVHPRFGFHNGGVDCVIISKSWDIINRIETLEVFF